MDLGEAGERLRRGTVEVSVKEVGGSGSGVIVGSTGLIVTNAHVVRGRHPLIALSDGRRFPGRLVALAKRHDLALVKVDTVGLPAIAFGDSDTLRPGELVLAVGNPLGFTGAMSMGVVHAVGPVYGVGPNRWVQADVRLAPGNSGGPLADSRGRLVGVNTMIARGLALAIPGNVVRDFVAKASAAAMRSKAA
jgi:serine protease Do